ncbi:MAG: hypothetical protein H7329_10870 [Opitutaceae bacterium]|nr:hypothetical protein [Cytophagales bacterium]
MGDSAFPVGGFAYSYGLESATKHGFFNDHYALRQYLITYSEQLISFDFAFISSAYNLDLTTSNPTILKEITEGYESMLLNPQVMKANLVIGKNWMKICKQLNQSILLEQLDMVFLEEKIQYVFPVVFACTMQLVNIQLQKALNLFFYMAIRDQISALIRLGIAGPARAHAELHFLLKNFSNRIETYIPIPFHEAYKSAYLMEISQLKHEKVYSKLFQN